MGTGAQLSNPLWWAAGAAWLACIIASASYIRYATDLAGVINTRCPKLWEKIPYRWRTRRTDFSGVQWTRAGGLENLVLFNTAAAEHPKDLDFHRLLRQARWAAALAFLAFVLAIISTGLADTSAVGAR